jgi:hypothetical protein
LGYSARSPHDGQKALPGISGAPQFVQYFMGPPDALGGGACCVGAEVFLLLANVTARRITAMIRIIAIRYCGLDRAAVRSNGWDELVTVRVVVAGCTVVRVDVCAVVLTVLVVRVVVTTVMVKFLKSPATGGVS